MSSRQATAGSATRERAGLRRVLIVLCFTEVISYGPLYYAFPVLAPRIAADTGWSAPAITAALSTGLIVSGLAGIPVGRWLDRYGPRLVMTAGSVLGTGALVLVATAGSLPWFFAAWLLAGVSMGGVFYAPAFTALTRWYGQDRVSALTTLTLVAGFASTIFAPLTAALVSQMSWRATYLVLAAALGILTVPAHALGLTLPWPEALTPATAAAAGPAGVPVVNAVRSRVFWTLAVAFSLEGFAVYAAAINLVPLLLGRGMSISAAVLALGLGGAGQVAGRLGYQQLTAWTSLRARTAFVLLIGAVTTGLLAVLPGPSVLLVGAAILSGGARGIFTLLQATAVSDRWGTGSYGRLNGLLSAPVTFAEALAPAAGAAIAGLLGGYPAMFAILSLMSMAAAGLAVSATPRPQLCRRSIHRRSPMPSHPDLEPASPQIQQRITTSFDKQGLMAHLGARLSHIGNGRVHIVLPYRPELTQQNGYIHAGATSAIADSAGGYAGLTLFPDDMAVLTIEFKINLLAPAKGDELEAEGVVVRSGRTLTVCRFEVFAVDDDERSLVAAGQQTLISIADR